MKKTQIILSLGLLQFVPIASAQDPPERKIKCLEGVTAHLEYGDHTSGCQVDTPFDIDFFTFSGSAGETIRFVLSTRTYEFNDLDPLLEVRDPFNNPVVDSGCTNNCWIDIDHTLTQTGSYQIRVSDFDFNSSGTYVLQIEEVKPFPYTVGLPYEASRIIRLDPMTDLDFVRFAARSGTELRFFVVASTNFGPYMHVRQPDGSVIWSENCNELPGGCSYSFDLTPTASGFHYLEFHEGGYNATGSIQLFMVCLFGSCPEGYFINSLVFTTPSEISWNPTSDADSTFDVVRGDLATLRSSDGDFSTAIVECVTTGSVLPVADVLEEPDPAQGFFYLVRAQHDEIGVGSYDTASFSQVSRRGGRDTGVKGIDKSPNDCSQTSEDGSFVSDEPNPGFNTVSMREGTAVGNMVTIDVVVTDTAGIYAASFDVVFDPEMVSFVGWAPGDLLEQGGVSVFYLVGENEPGRLAVGATRQAAATTDAIGTRSLIRMTFQITQVGESMAAFANQQLLDGQAPPQPIPGISWFGGLFVGD